MVNILIAFKKTFYLKKKRVEDLDHSKCWEFWGIGHISEVSS